MYFVSIIPVLPIFAKIVPLAFRCSMRAARIIEMYLSNYLPLLPILNVVVFFRKKKMYLIILPISHNLYY